MLNVDDRVEAQKNDRRDTKSWLLGSILEVKLVSVLEQFAKLIDPRNRIEDNAL